MELGVIPYARVVVIQKNKRNLLFFTDNKEFAVDIITASGIFVEVVK
jgi:hypothetical protein